MSTTLNRRTFLGRTAGATVGAHLHPAPRHAVETSAQVRTVAFDAFPIFDPRPIFALAEEVFPGRGAELSKAWRTRQAIAFAAFAGWDASGAKWFGFPAIWVNRLNAPAEELNVSPDLTCSDLSGLVAFANSRR
ncbi:MAG TPA: hypothetical protein VJA21_01520 [Verrucomicrobiae bacterium]